MENEWRVTQSWKLSESEAEQLESKLKLAPNDLYARLLLVGYYAPPHPPA